MALIFLSTSDGVNIKGGRDGIHLTLSREGRPSGEAYIEVASEEDVALAEKKHNQHMGRRYIEGMIDVFICTDRGIGGLMLD